MQHQCKYCEGYGKDHGEHVGIIYDCDDKECGNLRAKELEMMSIIEDAILELETAIHITNNPDEYFIHDKTNLDTLEDVLAILRKAQES